ncbi:unnamed protein product [marine sediment metagenome]|uniref:Uncharacterized protein n=1 Tax=marine sediment metagenome TaxID=412755 RepID=X1CKA0_9ZZZZ
MFYDFVLAFLVANNFSKYSTSKESENNLAIIFFLATDKPVSPPDVG